MCTIARTYFEVRWGQLALLLRRELKDTPENQLDCEYRGVTLTHVMYEYTWKCGKLKLYFSPFAGG